MIKAWQRTKDKVLQKRRKKWNKKGFAIRSSQFRCDRCKNIYSLSLANYHHRSYQNWYGGNGWSNPSNVIIICRNCHEHIHRRKIKRENKRKGK